MNTTGSTLVVLPCTSTKPTCLGSDVTQHIVTKPYGIPVEESM